MIDLLEVMMQVLYPNLPRRNLLIIRRLSRPIVGQFGCVGTRESCVAERLERATAQDERRYATFVASRRASKNDLREDPSLNRKAVGIAVGTFALATVIIIGRSLRGRAPKREDFGSLTLAPKVASPPTAVAETSRPSETKLEAEPSKSPVDARLHPALRAVSESVASTVAAFSLEGEDADYAAHDERAQNDASRAEDSFLTIRNEIEPDVARCFEAVIDQLQAAQLQLMAFAINRKNRGAPDSSQVEAEVADRKAFENEVRPLLNQLKAAIG